jgi:hypothetical protein
VGEFVGLPRLSALQDAKHVCALDVADGIFADKGENVLFQAGDDLDCVTFGPVAFGLVGIFLVFRLAAFAGNYLEAVGDVVGGCLASFSFSSRRCRRLGQAVPWPRPASPAPFSG